MGGKTPFMQPVRALSITPSEAQRRPLWRGTETGTSSPLQTTIKRQGVAAHTRGHRIVSVRLAWDTWCLEGTRSRCRSMESIFGRSCILTKSIAFPKLVYPARLMILVRNTSSELASGRKEVSAYVQITSKHGPEAATV